MATYTTGITREASLDPLIPTPVSAQVIKEMPQASAILQLARRVNMGTKTFRQPVLATLPEAYFVTGDTGMKQTSTVEWDNVILTAEELAVIVPIPEAYLDDSQVPIWNEIRPLIVEAIGRKLDLATLFGVSKPSTWSEAIEVQARVAGNTVTEGAGEDLADDIAALGEKLALDGIDLNGFAAAPSTGWRLRRLRSDDGIPIYQPLQGGGTAGSLYGYPLPEVKNGGWNKSVATVLAGDWTKAIIGIRQDMTFKMFTEGVISDDSGNVVLNLMQQDSVAMRVVMRVAFATANPVNPVNSSSSTRNPFAVLAPAAS